MKFPPVNAPSPLQKFRWPALTLVALCLGLPVGRAIRSALYSPPVASTPAPSPKPPTRNTPATSLESVSDEAVEAEISRLVGNVSSFAGTRTPAQVIDAISAANNEKSDLKRFADIYEAVSELGRNDLADALKRAREENNAIAIRAIERRWAEIDPLGAAKLVSESGGTMKLDDAFFASWSKINPSAALSWLESLPDGDQKSSARNSVLNSIAKTDPQRALDLASQLAEGADRSQLINRALDTLSAKDPALALAAARSLPEGPSRTAGLDNVVSKLASSNLEEAQRILAELPPNTLTSAGSSIASALAKTDPEKALAWANTLPEGTTRASAYGALANAWASKDVEAAATWLDKLPQGQSRDSAVAAFAGRTAPRDPEGATLWASTLPPGDLRNSVLGRTLSIWQRTNAQAATDWITSTPGLTPEERANLTKAAQEPPDRRRFRGSPQNQPGQ
ncbi:MAG: hypothetical protein WCO60_09235 [Verrucomicrobiota bacterium]